MTTGSLLFLMGSWTFVIGLAAWSFWKILRVKHRRPVDDSP